MNAASGELRLGRVIARLNVGGPAIHVILMTDALRRRGYLPLLLAGDVPPGEASMEYLAEERGVTFTRIAGMSRGVSGWRDLSAFVQLVRLFRAERLTIVHTHTAKAGALGRLAAAVSRVPVRVHTFHGHVFTGYFPAWKSRIVIAVERFLARFTDRIVAISESQLHDLVDIYRITDRSKVRVVPLGLDLDAFLSVDAQRGALRQAIGCPDAVPLVGWIGRLTAVKAPERFVDVAEGVVRSGGAARFVMVGDGELLSPLAGRLAQQNPGGVTLAGASRSMPDVYADLDVLVLTSVNEGTPVALIECMAAGRPFVATAVGGVADLMCGVPVQHEGFQVFDNGIMAVQSVEAIQAAVEFLLARPDVGRRMGVAGRRFVAERFSVSRLADDLDRLYREVLAEKSSRSSARSAHDAAEGRSTGR